MNKLKILVIEDDQSFCLVISRWLKESEVKTTSNVSEALEFVKKENFNLAIVDYKVNGNETGVDFLKKINEQKSSLPVIIISGYTTKLYGGQEIYDDCMNNGCKKYLEKPLDKNDLLQAIEECLN